MSQIATPTRHRIAAAPRSQEFPDLNLAEKLMLWGIRIWVRLFLDGKSAVPVLKEGFELAGIDDGAVAIDSIMSVIASASVRTLDVRCPDCRQLSNDELRLLGAVAAAQTQELGKSAPAYLSVWLPPTAMRIAAAALPVLAAAFRDRGLMVRPRPWVHGLSATGDPVTHRPAADVTLH